VPGKAAAVAAGCQSHPEDPLADGTTGTTVPEHVPLVFTDNGRGKDVRVIKLARAAERDDRTLGITLPLLGAQPAFEFLGNFFGPGSRWKEAGYK
jgi:hypothetical protein